MKHKLFYLFILCSVVPAFAQQKVHNTVQTVAFEKDAQFFLQQLAVGSIVAEVKDFSSLENKVYPQDLLVRFPDQVSEKLIINEGWVFYTGVQSPYNSNKWLCLERTIIGPDYNLFLFDAANAEKRILMNSKTVSDKYAFRPVCWSSDTNSVYLELIQFDSPFEHEGIFTYNLQNGYSEELPITKQYMSTPLLSPDKELFMYTATNSGERDMVHGTANQLIIYTIGNKEERILSAEAGASYLPIGWYTELPFEKKKALTSANESSAQLSFKLPWMSGTTYCVTRDGSNAPPGSAGSSSSCANLGPHSYPAATDFDTPNNAGHKILAVAAGTVTTAVYSNTGYGNHVIITHSDGYRTLYGHFNSLAVTQGQQVTQGCYLGIEGTTGNSSGDHLHFEYEYPGGSGNLYATFTDCGGCVPHRGYAYTSSNSLQSCSSIAAPPAPTISNSSACGSVVLTRATPPAGVTYYWQGTSCGTSTSNSASTYTATTSGTYHLRAKNSSGVWSATCGSQSVTVTQAPATPPVPTVSGNSCGTKVLTRASPPAGITYYWQTTCGNSITNSALTYSTNISGTYRLKARSGPNCWSTSCAAVSVVVNPSPAPVITGQNAVCAGAGGITYSVASSGNNFSWNITGGTISSGQNTNTVNVNWAGSGTGVLTVTETNPSTNCSTTATINVSINSSLNPAIVANGPTTFCQGENVVLDASWGFSSYLWSNGATTQQITVTDSGAYSVTVVDAWGCSGASSQPLNVAVIPAPEVPTISYSDNLMTSSSATGNQWYWDSIPIDGAAGQSLGVTQEGTYMVVVTDPNTGCAAASQVFNPATVGVQEAEVEEEADFKIYPNPNNGIFIVYLNPSSAWMEIEVINVLGELVFKERMKSNTAEIVLNTVSNGIYFVKVKTDNKMYSKKIIIR